MLAHVAPSAALAVFAVSITIDANAIAIARIKLLRCCFGIDIARKL